MYRFDRRSKAREWGRLAAKIGLLLTEPKVRAAIKEEFRDRMDSVSDTIARGYEDTVDRLEAAGDALQGKANWSAPAIALLLGFGAGAGLGILLAPGSGRETRQAIRDRAAEFKKRAVKSASSTINEARSAAGNLRPTGTEI